MSGAGCGMGLRLAQLKELAPGREPTKRLGLLVLLRCFWSGVISRAACHSTTILLVAVRKPGVLQTLGRTRPCPRVQSQHALQKWARLSCHRPVEPVFFRENRLHVPVLEMVDVAETALGVKEPADVSATTRPCRH